MFTGTPEACWGLGGHQQSTDKCVPSFPGFSGRQETRRGLCCVQDHRPGGQRAGGRLVAGFPGLAGHWKPGRSHRDKGPPGSRLGGQWALQLCLFLVLLQVLGLPGVPRAGRGVACLVGSGQADTVQAWEQSSLPPGLRTKVAFAPQGALIWISRAVRNPPGSLQPKPSQPRWKTCRKPARPPVCTALLCSLGTST